jgi:hypothetical protein
MSLSAKRHQNLFPVNGSRRSPKIKFATWVANGAFPLDVQGGAKENRRKANRPAAVPLQANTRLGGSSPRYQ